MGSPSTNFLPFNPTGANAESDSAYTSDSQRTGGASTGSFAPSLTYNKGFLQWSMGISALLWSLALKNFSSTDGTTPFTARSAPSPGSPEANLVAVFNNLLTTADYSTIETAIFSGFVCNVSAQSFYFKAPTALGGFVIQGGVGVTVGNPYTQNFPVGFTVVPVVVAVADSGTIGISLVGSPPTVNNFTVQAAGGLHFQWIAVGK